MPGLGSVLNIGRGGLFSSQSAIETTSNNISNVETPGYSRRNVRLEEAPSIDYKPGQLGTGVRAEEVLRSFDNFVEEQYLNKNSDFKKWEQLTQTLESLETSFDNSEESGLNEALSEFWGLWQELAESPQDGGVRNSLLGKSQSLLNIVQMTDQDISRLQDKMEDYIKEDVDRVNEILEEIASVNQQITEHKTPNNNPNRLMDKRNELMRELSELIDVKVFNEKEGDLMLTTRAGHTLVDGREHFKLDYQGPRGDMDLRSNSTFAENGGEMRFEGSSSNEYEVRVQSLNDTDGDSVNDEAVLEFSVDGGKSWLDETKTYTQDDLEENSKIELPHSDVTFSLNNTDTATIDDLEKGDQFNAMPKSGLYWHKSAGSEINVTPMRMENGKDNPRRIVGGSLAAEFNFRDDFAGEIRDRMNEFAKSLIWETNRVHSQGAGLSKLQEVTGTYKSENPSAAMDSEDSGLSFFDRLQDGDVSFYMYDNSTGDLVASDSVHFQSGDSMQDLVDKINNSNTSKGKLGNFMDASIENGKLQLQAEDGHSFAVGGDSSGVLSATGINTFFQGSDARDIAMNSKVNNNTDLINAAHVNGAGEVNPGDNQTAKDIAALQDTQVDFETLSEGETEQTLQDYYNGLSSDVGSKTSEAEDNKNFFKSLTEDLKSRQDSVSGVNMDEEMTNLIKFQQMYTASAKLITTTEEMMQTLMQIKR